MADRLDCHFGFRGPVHEIEQAERRDRDPDQNDHRDNGPKHFDQRVMRKFLRRRISLRVKAKKNIGQETDNEDGHDDAYPEQNRVETDDSFHRRAVRILEAKLPIFRRLGHGDAAANHYCREEDRQSGQTLFKHTGIPPPH